MKTVTKTVLTLLFIPLFLLLVQSASAQTEYDWTGAADNNWKNPNNWIVGDVAGLGGSIPATYPGQTGNTDKVTFGLYYFFGYGPGSPAGSTSYHPILAATDSVSVASFTIGDNSSTNFVQTNIFIDIEGKLNVTGTILQQHSNNVGFVGDGSIAFPLGYDFHIQTFFYGAGKVYAGTIQIGDNTLPTINGISNVTRFKIGDNLGTAGLGLTTVVSGNFIVNSVSRNDAVADTIISLNNANVSMEDGGSLTIGGQLILQNTGDINYNPAKPSFQPQASFNIQARNNGANTTLYLQGAHALSCPFPVSVSGQTNKNYFDFYYIGNTPLTNMGTTTVVYSGNTNQEVYTSDSFSSNLILDHNGGNYQHLAFSGSGQKIIDATPTVTLTLGGNITLLPGTETVDLSTNNPSITLNNGSNTVFSFGSPSTNPPFTSYTVPLVSTFTSAVNTSFVNGGNTLAIPGTTTNGGTFTTNNDVLRLQGAFNNTGTFNTGAVTIVTGTTTNSGILNQTGNGNQLTFNGIVNNSGTINDTGTSALSFNNTFNNTSAAALVSQTVGTININNSYTNAGTFKATGGTVNINQTGVNQSLFDNSAATAGTTFFNVNVKNGNTVTLSGSGAGQFHVASTGSLTMVANTNLAANGFLTLNSDVNGAATLANVPTTCNITGNVTVQRYMSANRSYRLMSSPVFTGNDGTNNIYGVNYLLTNTYLTGTGGGFSKVGNPTLYLYRENLAPQFTTFLNSNFIGIGDITGTPYGMNDPVYPTANIPVGSGYLFYFRGSSKQASLATLTTAGAAATTDTLNAVGTLNIGNVTVHDWYTPTSGNLGYTTASGNPTIEGMNLVGNPYASSIDWDKYGVSILETNVTKFSYKLVPTGIQGAGNYDVYAAGTATKKGTQGTANANIIASGEGFFVQATNVGPATLTFTEAAKSNTLVTGANLYMAKLPSAATVVPQYLRLQLAMDTINTDGSIITFNANANTGFYPNEDARYRAGSGKVSLSSISSDNVPLAINTLPLTTKGQTIPLSIGATAGGTYSLNLKEISGIPQLYDVWLKDAFTKDSVNMRTTASYSFSINKADTNTFGTRRFRLVLSQDTAYAYKLNSFTAAKVGNNPQVQLAWKTQNEQNYTNFTVERSTDGGKSFDVIGSVKSSGEGTYSLLDKNPGKGENQYKLKQEDFNNTVTYSNVVMVTVMFSNVTNNSVVTNLSVYPNPTANIINLTIIPKSSAASSYKIRVSNSVGTVVKNVNITQLNWQDNVSQLLTGTYLVQVIDNTDNTIVGQTKFIKL